MKCSLKLVSIFIITMLSFANFAMAAEEPKVFRVATASDPESLDPQMHLSGPLIAYAHWVFDPLVRWTQDMKFEPRLAEKWKQINPTTIRFYLRKGVKFHSGNPFTAKDVAWSLERLKKSPDFKGLFSKVDNAKIIDDYTIDIITKEPYSLVMNLATYIFPMDSKFYTGTDESGQPKDLITKTGYSFANDNASGTGPYSVLTREHGTKLILEANKNYWGKKGNVDRLELIPIKTEATRIVAILNGDVDFMYPVPIQNYDQLSKNPEIELITMPSPRIITMQLNQKRRPELANPKVREALIAATDTEGIVAEIMRGYTTTTQQQANKNYPGYDPNLKPRYNLERAKNLMKEAGYENGLEFTMIAPNNRYVNDEKIAHAFVSMMAKIGVRVNLKTMPKAQFWTQYDAQVADIQMIGWYPDTEDTTNYSEYLLVTPNKETGMGQYNSGNYSNPEFDALIMAANREVNAKKNYEILRKAEEIAYNDAAYIPFHWDPLAWAARKNVKNAAKVVNVQNFPFLGDIVID